jgi:hypothetical protein
MDRAELLERAGDALGLDGDYAGAPVAREAIDLGRSAGRASQG